MEDKKSIWPFAMKYGSTLGLLSVIVSIVFYVVMPMDPEKGMGGGWIQSVLTLGIFAAYIYWAVAKFRDEENEGLITYGRSLGLSMAMSIPAALITGIYIYIFFTWIDPDLMTKIADAQANKLAEKGMSDEQIESQMAMMNKVNNPMFYAFVSPLGSAFQILIISLITSIFTRREPASDIQ